MLIEIDFWKYDEITNKTLYKKSTIISKFQFHVIFTINIYLNVRWSDDEKFR